MVSSMPRLIHYPKHILHWRETRRAYVYGSPHSRTVLSSEPEAISVPSGEKATQFTIPLCPSSVCRSSPLFTFHNLMVLSPEAEAISVPSGENATSLTLRLCPSSACRSSPLFTLHNRTV